MRKSIVVKRSNLPIGASSRQTTSRGRHSGGASSLRTASFSTPSACRRKYSCPLLEEPSRFARPQRQDTRPVAGAVRVLGGEAESAGLQLADDVVLDVDAFCFGGGRDLERVPVEGRIGRHPAEASRERISSRRGASRRASRCRASRRSGRRRCAGSGTGRSSGTRTALLPAGAAVVASRARTRLSTSR